MDDEEGMDMEIVGRLLVLERRQPAIKGDEEALAEEAVERVVLMEGVIWTVGKEMSKEGVEVMVRVEVDPSDTESDKIIGGAQSSFVR